METKNNNNHNENHHHKNESNNYYISSRGLMKLCDYYSPNPVTGTKQMIDYPSFSKSLHRPIIHVHSSAISYFIKNILKDIDFSFILVSNDSDCTCPMNIFSTRHQYHQFIEDSRIIHWFVQNYTEEHEKITSIPIGIDYHSMMTENTHLGDMISCENQEFILNEIIAQSKPFHERFIKCYANFQFAMNTRFAYDRHDAMFNIDPTLVFYEPKRLERKETWFNQSNYAFVLSPHGNGLDCYRTWESLMLGCIPIVKKSKIDVLYTNLPVLIVERWQDITNELLIQTIHQFQHQTFQYEKLSLEYWKQIILSYR